MQPVQSLTTLAEWIAHPCALVETAWNPRCLSAGCEIVSSSCTCLQAQARVISSLPHAQYATALMHRATLVVNGQFTFWTKGRKATYLALSLLLVATPSTVPLPSEPRIYRSPPSFSRSSFTHSAACTRDAASISTVATVSSWPVPPLSSSLTRLSTTERAVPYLP